MLNVTSDNDDEDVKLTFNEYYKIDKIVLSLMLKIVGENEIIYLMTDNRIRHTFKCVCVYEYNYTHLNELKYTFVLKKLLCSFVTALLTMNIYIGHIRLLYTY